MGAVPGSWCLHVHVASAFSRGVQHNVDDSRGSAVIRSLSRRRRARQFSGFLGSPPRITSGSFSILRFGFTPWVAPGLFCVLGSAFSLWVVPGAFCVVITSSFSLGSLTCFGIFMSGFGASLACLGWAAWFVRFCFLFYRPLAQCWARGGPFLLVSLVFFRHADPPTQYGDIVWVIGPCDGL